MDGENLNCSFFSAAAAGFLAGNSVAQPAVNWWNCSAEHWRLFLPGEWANRLSRGQKGMEESLFLFAWEQTVRAAHLLADR